MNSLYIVYILMVYPEYQIIMCICIQEDLEGNIFGSEYRFLLRCQYFSVTFREYFERVILEI